MKKHRDCTMSVILFDENEEPYTFDEKLYQKNYPKLKEIIDSIVCRLSEINDGGFEIDNQIK